MADEEHPDDNDASVLQMFQAFANSGDAPACPLRDAIRDGERETALQLVEQGSDPFSAGSVFALTCSDALTAFHEASARNDLHLMLAMAAEPESAWVKRFVISQNSMVDVPVHGRSCVSTASSNSGNFFEMPGTVSMEGLEVMTMYGYVLKARDFEYSILPLALRDPQKIPMFKFALASLRLNSTNQLKLEKCLGMAIGGTLVGSFDGGIHQSSIEMAHILLSSGSDPNGYCFQGTTPYDHLPVLFQAVANGDRDMVELLVSYGADMSGVAQFSSWTDDGSLDIEHITILDKAREMNMENALTPPETLRVADKEKYTKKLRRELEAPLRRHVTDYSSGLVVAMMRATANAPPVGLMSKLILDYCPLGFNLWQTESGN